MMNDYWKIENKPRARSDVKVKKKQILPKEKIDEKKN